MNIAQIIKMNTITILVLEQLRKKSNQRIEYQTGKINFVVNPIHKKTGENMNDIMKRLMQYETQNPWFYAEYFRKRLDKQRYLWYNICM